MISSTLDVCQIDRRNRVLVVSTLLTGARNAIASMKIKHISGQ